MSGPGPGEARIIVEAGAARFVARSALKGDVTAVNLLASLLALTDELRASLERVAAREKAGAA